LRVDLVNRKRDDIMTHSNFVRFLGAASLFGFITTTSLEANAVGTNSPQPGARVDIPLNTSDPVRFRKSPDPQLLNLNSTEGRFAEAPALDNQGLIDGVYACDVILGGTTERMLLSFNGKSNGQTIYVVASIKTYYVPGYTRAVVNQPFRGWGLGRITAAGFVGTTWNGQPFSFTLLGLEESTSRHIYDVLRIAGNVGIDANTTARLVCKTDHALF
jgi:hypothetical protein